MRQKIFNVIAAALFLSLLAGCGSAQIKARKEQREKLSQSAHIYCAFINGEQYPDIDVALNIEMAKRCDAEKSMTVSNYRSPSDSIGLVFCCSTREDASAPTAGAKADSTKETTPKDSAKAP